MNHSLELQQLIEHSEKTGTKSQLDGLLFDLEHLIMNGLSTNLTSSNPEFKTITGNLYQSLQLYSHELGGFRTPRENLFAGIRLSGKNVSDYGSNLGEISRMAALLGAAQVSSYEYEPYFVLMARLINTLLGFESIRTYLADISTAAPYKDDVDISVALSVDTFISSQLANVAKHTRELLVYESHAVEKAVLSNVIRKLMSHFPHVALIDAFDHGKGLRSWRALCLASRFPLDKIIHARFSKVNSNIRLNIDLSRSDFVFWPRTGELPASWAENVRRANMELQCHGANVQERACEEVAANGIAGSKLYWSAFTVGLDQAKQGIQLEENLYFKLLNGLIDRKIYDQLLGILRDSEPIKFLNRIRSRLELYSLASQNLSPITVNGLWSASKENVGSTGNSIFLIECSQNYAAIIFDGFHRLYAALLNGLSACPVQCIIYPQIENLKLWHLDLEEMKSVTTRCIEDRLVYYEFASLSETDNQVCV